MSDGSDLRRFVDAQAPLYERVCAELRAGRKQSHWMWFVFPQLKGLGHSAMAVRYGIASLEEAVAYLHHPILGPRLIECTELVTAVNGRSVEEILGAPDDLKLCSCLTLFMHADPDCEIFTQALARYFDGKPDERTIELLSARLS